MIDVTERAPGAGTLSHVTSKAGLYFTLAAIGLVSQLAIVGIFLADEGVNLAEFAEQAVDSTIAVLALADLLLCAVVFLIWSAREARRVGIAPWWPFALATMGGLCFAFPLFLGCRERRRAEAGAGGNRPASAPAAAA